MTQGSSKTVFSKEEAPSERYLKGEPKQDCQRWEDGWGKPKVREDTSNPNRYKGHVIDLVEVHAPPPGWMVTEHTRGSAPALYSYDATASD